MRSTKLLGHGVGATAPNMMSLERIGRQRIVLKDPGRFTPFAFPILVDRLREKLTSEQLEDRIRKMTERLEKG